MDYSIKKEKHTKTLADIWILSFPIKPENMSSIYSDIKSSVGYSKWNRVWKGYVFQKKDPTTKLVEYFDKIGFNRIDDISQNDNSNDIELKGQELKDQKFYDLVAENIQNYNISEDSATLTAYETLGYYPKYSKQSDDVLEPNAITEVEEDSIKKDIELKEQENYKYKFLDNVEKGDVFTFVGGDSIHKKLIKNLIVKSNNIVSKGKPNESRKITFANVDNLKGVKYYAYFRFSGGYSGKGYSFAIGDSSFSVDSIEKNDELTMTKPDKIHKLKGNIINQADYNKAYEIGVSSLKNEYIKVPSQDKELFDFLFSKPERNEIGNNETIELMKVWNKARFITNDIEAKKILDKKPIEYEVESEVYSDEVIKTFKQSFISMTKLFNFFTDFNVLQEDKETITKTFSEIENLKKKKKELFLEQSGNVEVQKEYNDVLQELKNAENKAKSFFKEYIENKELYQTKEVESDEIIQNEKLAKDITKYINFVKENINKSFFDKRYEKFYILKMVVLSENKIVVDEISKKGEKKLMKEISLTEFGYFYDKEQIIKADENYLKNLIQSFSENIDFANYKRNNKDETSYEVLKESKAEINTLIKNEVGENFEIDFQGMNTFTILYSESIVMAEVIATIDASGDTLKFDDPNSSDKYLDNAILPIIEICNRFLLKEKEIPLNDNYVHFNTKPSDLFIQVLNGEKGTNIYSSTFVGQEMIKLYGLPKKGYYIINKESQKYLTNDELPESMKKRQTLNKEKAKTHIYNLGDKYRSDFDTEGMLKVFELRHTLDREDLKKLHTSLEDLNFHSENKKVSEILNDPFIIGDKVFISGLPEKVKAYLTKGQPMIDNPYNNEYGVVVHYQNEDVRVKLDKGISEAFGEENVTNLTLDPLKDPELIEIDNFVKDRQEELEIEKPIEQEIDEILEKDYFEFYDEQPKEVQDILSNYNFDEGVNYDKLDFIKGELNEIGWTMDYGLSAEPYDLRPLKDFEFKEEEQKEKELIEQSLDVSQQNSEIDINTSFKSQRELNEAIKQFVNETSERTDFTLEEKQFISQYSGSGGQLKKGEEKTKEAFSEFYTPDLAVKKMWLLAHKYGFRGGKLLEPSVGTGNFLKYVDYINCDVTAYELNELTSKIVKILYPETTVINKSFSTHFYGKSKFDGNLPDNYFDKDFDLIIGNPPYGEQNHEKKISSERKLLKVKGDMNLEHYFMIRGLDCLKVGGLLIYLTTNNVFFKDFQGVKELISDRANLVDAYLLPNKTFKNTMVGTAIIVLRKK